MKTTFLSIGGVGLVEGVQQLPVESIGKLVIQVIIALPLIINGIRSLKRKKNNTNQNN